jgi:hypothetical protein
MRDFGREGRAGMKHFFFDFTTTDQSLYDYRGEKFASLQSAIEFAQETVRMLKHSLSDNWTGWSVEVRGAEGNKYLSLPVGADLASVSSILSGSSIEHTSSATCC